ncbi:MAG: hypothetical protein KF905_12080 [Flavobacteriales bacterium]|nr:hypothetical protein [Flavobacteriales bacterium]
MSYDASISNDPANDRCDIAEASDNLGIQALARPVTKWYLAWPRWVGD